MEVRYATRVKLGIALIVFAILVPSLRQLTSTLASFRALPATDDISQYERRFNEVKHFLPPNQIVSYSDEFSKNSRKCNAFVLAQYSVTPTVLAVLDSKCGYISNTDEVSSHKSRLVLDNSHDPQHEPYLLRFFPSTYFQPDNNPAAITGSDLSHADQLVLLKDFGLGVRLYAQKDK